MRATRDQRGTKERKEPGERGGLRLNFLVFSIEYLVKMGRVPGCFSTFDG
jgi:hypothetical protein